MPKDPFKLYLEQDRIKDKNVETYQSDKDIDDLISGKMRGATLKKSLNQKQLFWLLLLASFGFLLLFGRVFYLQVMQGAHYRAQAEGNRIRILGTPASRGIIYDREGIALTQNVPNFYLQVIPADLPEETAEKQNVVNQLAELLEKNNQEITEFFGQLPQFSYQPVILAEYLEHEKAVKIKAQTSTIPGVSLEMSAIREYPFAEKFAHVLGYTGKLTEEEYAQDPEKYLVSDYIGKTGLELQYEDQLKGTNGKKEIEVDSFGKEKKVIANQEAIIGQNLVTSLSFGLQEALYDSLQNSIDNSGGFGGAAIALDPRNGEVLALVSAGSFNPNLFVKGISSQEYSQYLEDPSTPLFVKPTNGEYPSGSTIKPVIAAAALQEGIIRENTIINSTGGIRIDKWFFPDWQTGGHGATDVKKAIAQSVNTFFYTIGGGTEDFDGLGVDRINHYAELFGFSQKSKIDLPSETTGFLPTKDWKEEAKNERWYIGDTYHLAIGQGDLLVTPLQIANMTAAVANGGKLYRPHLQKEFTDSKSILVSAYQPELLRTNFIDPGHLKTIRQGMRQAVTEGSSRALANLAVAAAGKTGTAQFSGGTHAWFTCFAPYENPEIVITVIVEGGGDGHAAALPVARSGLNHYFSQ